MKRIYRGLADNKLKLLVVALTVLLGVFTTGVNADDSVDTTIRVARSISNAPSKVTNTYTYKITPSESNPGIATGLIDQFTIAFNNETCEGASCKKETTINFNNLTYSKIGDYTFKVKEIASSDNTSFPITNDEWTVIISVRNKTNQGVPTGEKIVKSYAVEDPDGNKSDTGINFVGVAKFSNIVITNTLEGNMADFSKYFKIRVKIEGNPGDTYTITGQDSTVVYDGETITAPTTYTVGSEPQYIYLKHEQKATIGSKTVDGSFSGMTKDNRTVNEIKIGSTYQATELDAEAYETHINGSANPTKVSDTYTLTESTGRIDFLNIYNADIITGFMSKYFGYVLMVIVAIVMLLIIKLTDKKGKKQK